MPSVAKQKDIVGTQREIINVDDLINPPTPPRRSPRHNKNSQKKSTTPRDPAATALTNDMDTAADSYGDEEPDSPLNDTTRMTKQERMDKWIAENDEEDESSDEDNNDDDEETESKLAATTPAKKKQGKKQSTAASAKKPGRKKPTDEQKRKQLAWIKGKNIDDVVLDAAGEIVVTIGNAPFKNMSVALRREFVRANNIQVAHMHRNKDGYGTVIVNHMKARKYQHGIKAPAKKKSPPALTRPAFVTKEGTFYRMVEVMTSPAYRACYIATLNPYDRANLEDVVKHRAQWGKLHGGYNDKDSFNALAIYEALMSYVIDKNICADYDYLDCDEAKIVAVHIAAKYKKARDSKNKSGNHRHFSEYTTGNHWLLYLNEKLSEIGDTNLMNCFYAELPSDAVRSSADGSSNYVPITKKKPSRSPSPPASASGKLTRTSKDAALVAASDAIAQSHREALHERKRELLKKLRGKLSAANLQLKRKSYRQMNKDNPKRAEKKAKHLVLTKNAIDWQQEYEKLKVELDYNSPAVDMSDSSEEEDIIKDANGGGNVGNIDNLV